MTRPACVALAASIFTAASIAATASAAPAAPGGTPARAAADDAPALLLVDHERAPTIEIRWTGPGGSTHVHRGSRPYAADAAREPLGGNIEAFAAVGGTRLSKGAGHPAGAIVRVGFYKTDNDKPWFEDISKDTEIEVVFAGVRFNQPVDVHARSVVQHLKYDAGDMEACGIPGDAREQLNTADRDDTLNDRVRPGLDARLGALDGSEGALGSVEVEQTDDGSVTLITRFRYPALRNLQDPWQSDLPNTFLEPIHLHIEFEALPAGTPPLDPARPRTAPTERAD